jgi:hypothetical protein
MVTTASAERSDMAGKNRRHVYVIVVEPELGPDDAPAFPGLRVTTDGGQTTISGPVADQAQLGEILNALAARNRMLVSIKRSDQPVGER